MCEPAQPAAGAGVRVEQVRRFEAMRGAPVKARAVGFGDFGAVVEHGLEDANWETMPRGQIERVRMRKAVHGEGGKGKTVARSEERRCRRANGAAATAYSAPRIQDVSRNSPPATARWLRVEPPGRRRLVPCHGLELTWQSHPPRVPMPPRRSACGCSNTIASQQSQSGGERR